MEINISEVQNYDKEIEELVLLLPYLTGWEEDIGISKEKMKELNMKQVLRSWKTFPFDILDLLQEKGYISGTHKAKSVYIQPEGIEKAKELFKKYIEDNSD
ncbi:transposase [bacterium]|nr:transposase [bacterium]